MEVGRDYRNASRQLELLERIATGIEKLAEEPVLEMEVAPPVCPHCGTFNPVVVMDDRAGEGPMVEYVVEMTCQVCGKAFWGLPIQWSLHLHLETLRQELQERAEHVRSSQRENAQARTAG